MQLYKWILGLPAVFVYFFFDCLYGTNNERIDQLLFADALWNLLMTLLLKMCTRPKSRHHSAHSLCYSLSASFDSMHITLINGISSSDITFWMPFAIPAPVVWTHYLHHNKCLVEMNICNKAFVVDYICRLIYEHSHEWGCIYLHS